MTTTAPTAAAIDAAVAAATSQSTSTVTINLTATVGEQIAGTSANETINGVVTGDASTSSTFNIGDVVNGGNGTDTFNITIVDGTGTGSTTGIPAGASVSGVEIVNVNISGAGVDVPTALNSANFAGVQQLWQIDSAVGGAVTQAITVGSGVTAGFRGAGDAFAVNVTQSSGSTVALAVDGVTTGSAIGILESTAGTVKTIGLTGSVAPTAGVANITLFGGATVAADTLNVGLSSNSTVAYVGGVANALKTVSLAGSTGKPDV